MMKPAGLLACALCLSGLFGASAFAATQVYKWIDSSGSVHYSEEPPPADATTKTVMIIHSGAPDDDSPMAGASSGSPVATARSGKTDKQKAADAAIAEENKANCPKWQQDIQTLGSIGRVRTPDANGDIHEMTEDEKNGRIAQDQAQVDQYCSN